MVSIDVLYDILRNAAQQKKTLTYLELTAQYNVRTGVYVHWQNWGAHLKALNEFCRAKDLPALSAVVVNAKRGWPGESYPGAKGFPELHSKSEWQHYLAGSVFTTAWPAHP